MLSFAGLAYSLFPYVVIVLPFIAGYTAWSYRVFRGKVSGDSHYG